MGYFGVLEEKQAKRTNLAGVPGTEAVGEEIQKAAASTPLCWLLAPVERVTAIVCHASSRALILLGIRHGKDGMIALGFLIFTLLDGVAGASHLSGKLGSISTWWFDAVLSLRLRQPSLAPMLQWSNRRYRDAGKADTLVSVGDVGEMTD